MKKTLLTVSLICLSFSVFACPDLSGEYKCKVYDYEYDIELEEKLTVEQNTDSITFDADTFIIDSKKHFLPFIAGWYKSSCQDDQKLTIKIKNLFGVKSYSDYVLTEEGFNIFRSKSRRAEKKIFKRCERI